MCLTCSQLTGNPQVSFVSSCWCSCACKCGFLRTVSHFVAGTPYLAAANFCLNHVQLVLDTILSRSWVALAFGVALTRLNCNVDCMIA